MKDVLISFFVVAFLVGAFLIVSCHDSTSPPQPAQKAEQGAPSYPATELTQAEARTIALNPSPDVTIVHYAQVKHIIKVGKGIPFPDGSYSLDYKTLEQADQLAPGENGTPTPPNCDCANGTHSWYCSCDPKHKILIIGIPDCCSGYCGQYGILIWCSGGCDSKVATCSDAGF